MMPPVITFDNNFVICARQFQYGGDVQLFRSVQYMMYHYWLCTLSRVTDQLMHNC